MNLHYFHWLQWMDFFCDWMISVLFAYEELLYWTIRSVAQADSEAHTWPFTTSDPHASHADSLSLNSFLHRGITSPSSSSPSIWQEVENVYMVILHICTQYTSSDMGKNVTGRQRDQFLTFFFYNSIKKLSLHSL